MLTAEQEVTIVRFHDAHHDTPRLHPLAQGTASVFSRRSPLKESCNEDAAALVHVDSRTGLILVADGCGGMANGEVASRLAVDAITKTTEAFTCTELDGGYYANPSLRVAILDGIEGANREIRQLGTGAATTLAVVEIIGDQIRTVHVGDSQILQVSNRGTVKFQTKAHSPVGYAVEAGVMTEEDAIHHEDRHLVSNVLGGVDMHIDIGSMRPFSARDTLLVATDGLFDNLHVDEIVEIIRKGPLDAAAQQLADLAMRRMVETDANSPSKPDDLTFVLYRKQK